MHVLHPIALRPQSQGEFVRQVEGKRIQKVERHGKYLFLILDEGLLAIHFRFDGQLIWFRSAKELESKANQKPGGVHVDVALELNGGVLGFADGRHFGRVHYWKSQQEHRGLRTLGVDALSKEFTAELLAKLLARSEKEIKVFLLDQTRVAGIGNIYSSEALWQAKIDPFRKANSLSDSDAVRLHKAIVRVLRSALECCLHPSPNFHDADWWFQGLEEIVEVYGRKDESCRRCGGTISRIEQAGRSTYCCKSCQKTERKDKKLKTRRA